MREISVLITEKLEDMAGEALPAYFTPNRISWSKAITALIPHAISLDKSGDKGMIDAIFDIPWSLHAGYIDSYAFALLSKPTPPSLNRAIVLLSPYLPQYYWDERTIARWAAAASALPYSEKVGWSVVGMLLQLASSETLWPFIPADIWEWLKRQPSLPPECAGRGTGTREDTVRYVRGLGDLDTLRSYFLLVWSEWNALDDFGFIEMQASIVEDLGGIGMHHHRVELITRLDHILGELDRGWCHLSQYGPAVWADDVQGMRYGSLKQVLLEVERKAMEILAGMSLTFINFSKR